MENNLASVEFTTEELQRLDGALNTIAEVLKGKTHNLTPAERKQFGRIAEQNKLFVDKAKNYMEQYPQYVPSFVDKAEFDKDHKAREVIETRLIRLDGLREQLADTKVLLDNDNYTMALTFYRNIKFLEKENFPGITNISQDLGQFFSRTKKKTDAKPEQ
ncbi:MAG: hypothetical protein Q4A00_06320 [Flavobacteriaceae bacterium]|nr:hypothetical protein [Flavobacteriaceae bacterium]